MFTRTKKSDILIAFILGLLISVPISVQFVYSWTGDTNTLSPGYIEFQHINGTYYYLGDTNITERLQYDLNQSLLTTSSPTFVNLTATQGIDLGGTYRTTWPSEGNGSGIERYPFSYLIFTNATSRYAINGITGSIDYSGTFTSVLQNSINAVNSAGGGDIYIQVGSYAISSIIYHKENVRIIGLGQTSWAGSAKSVYIQISNDAHYFYINDTDCSIFNVIFYGHWDTGIEEAIRIEDTGTNINNVQIKNCVFRGFKKGIHFLNAFGSSAVNGIEYCVFITPQSALGHGIYAEDFSHWTLVGNHFLVNNYANSSGIYMNRSATETYPHTERITLINNGFNGGSLVDAAIVVDVHRAGDNRGELDGLTIIGGNIENFATGIHIKSDGVRSTITLQGTTFFSTSIQEILCDSGTDKAYITAIECYGLNTITNNGNAKIKIEGEWTKYNAGTLVYLPAEVYQTNNPNGNTPAVNSTLYYPLEGELTNTNQEQRCQLTIPRDGILRNLRVFGTAHASINATVTVRVETADSSLTLTITAGGGEAWYSDTTHTVSVTAGDLVCFKIITGNGSPTLRTLSVEYIG